MFRPFAHFNIITKHRPLVMKYCFMAGILCQSLKHDLSNFILPRTSKDFQGRKEHVLIPSDTLKLLEELLQKLAEKGEKETFSYMRGFRKMSFVEIGFGFARYKAKIHEDSFAKTS